MQTMSKKKTVDKLIQRFIVWYLKKNNVEFKYGTFTVRMFTTKFYENVMDKYFEFCNSNRNNKFTCSITNKECSKCEPGPCDYKKREEV